MKPIVLFKLKKLWLSKWLLRVACLVVLLAAGVFLFEGNAMKSVRQQESAALSQARGLIVTEQVSLRDGEPERYQQLLQQHPSLFSHLIDAVETADEQLQQRNSQEFIENKLTYYQGLPDYEQILHQQDLGYTSVQKEDIYYLQALKKQGQPYENRLHGTVWPQFLVHLLSYIAEPLFFILFLLVFLLPFSQEKENKSLCFMYGNVPSTRGFLLLDQLICLVFALAGLGLLVVTGVGLSRSFGEGLFQETSTGLATIVDTSYRFQTALTTGEVLLIFWLLAVVLMIFYLSLYYCFSLYIKNSVLAMGAFLLTGGGLAFLLKGRLIVGNPFRFHELKTFALTRPTLLDMMLSLAVAGGLCLLIQLVLLRKKNLILGVNQ